jgi:hypothetical protein
MRIAITNYHTAYIYMLAKTGHDIFVFNPAGRGAWDARQRPLPPNVTLMDNVNTTVNLLTVPPDFFDVVILQDTVVKGADGTPDILDRQIWERINAKKILLFHNSFYINFRGVPIEQEATIKGQLIKRLEGIDKVFISEFKKKSWGMDGRVILPGVDIEEFGGWRGIEKSALCCLNNANFRDFMNGTSKMKLACIDYGLYMLGEENGQGRLANGFEHLKQHYRDFLAYMCLNDERFEDGYNLSGLEAMATGMPMITLDHKTSPIVNGVNGFRSNDLQEINKFLHGLTQEQAYKLGRQARETVIKQFPVFDFIQNWNEALGMK